MKYLKLYEAFESTTISKVINYLRTKVDKQSVDRFKNRLLKMQQEIDIPLSNIKDDNVKYLNRFKALKFKSDNIVDNSKGIYCLKFWFSLDEGFLGFTATGNKVINYEKSMEGRGEIGNDMFTDSELEYIKSDLGVKTGLLKPLKNYEDLRHDQLIFGIFSDDSDDIGRLAMAKVWRDGDRIYAIQNVASGGEPDYDVDNVNWREWLDGDKFRYSWSLDSVDSPGDDHHKLHIYIPSEEPIKIKGKEVKKEESENPLDYNLPTNSRFNYGSWRDYDWSINNSDVIDKADFAVVLIIDDLLKSGLTPVSLTKKGREESKEGALGLMSDEQIKTQNIERYLTQVVSKTINIDTTEIKDLQNIIIKNVCGKFAFISLFKSRPSLEETEYILGNLYNSIRSESIEDKKYYLEQAKSRYKRLYSNSLQYSNNYQKSMALIEKCDSPEIKEQFKFINKISLKILTYLKSQKIETIQDLRMILIKLESILKISRTNEFEISGILRSIMNEFHYPEDIQYYINSYEEGDKRTADNMVKLKDLERYVDSILR